MPTPGSLPFSIHIDTLTCRVFNPPSGCIDDDAIEANAAIQASKIQRHQSTDWEAVGTTDLVTTGNKVLHTVRGTSGTIIGFESVHYSTALTTATFVAIDLQKATAASTWATVLTAPITIASSDAAYTPRAATISAAGMSDGDIFRAVWATSGSSTNLPRGLSIHLMYTETYS